MGLVDSAIMQYDVAQIMARALNLKVSPLWTGNNHQDFFDNNK